MSVLTAVDQELKVSDLQIPAGVTVLSDASVGVVKVGALVSRAAEEQAAADAAAQAVIPAEAEQADAGEGADVAEAPVEKKPEEEKKPETK